MEYPDKLKKTIDYFSLLPGVGKKTAERLALHLLIDFDNDDIIGFSKSIHDITTLHICKNCHNISDDEDLCEICKDPSRIQDVILVVETIKDVFVIERMKEYNGLYHVLNGAINFSNGIGIEDINVDSLIKKVENNTVKEIILATNATIEGETTARYIKAMLEDYDCSVTRIAHGLPVGGDIGYADEMTLLKALEGRRKY